VSLEHSPQRQRRRHGRILRSRAVCELCGLSRSTIWRMIARDEFPKPFAITAGTTGWSEVEILDWIDGRVERRSSKEQPESEAEG
jgi:prophage regulatory protein